MLQGQTENCRPDLQLLPSTHAIDNWNNLLHGTLPIVQGMLNSLIIAGLSAVLSVYFSTMTAYAIHAYDFKLKKYIYPFILDGHDDPDTGDGAWIRTACIPYGP